MLLVVCITGALQAIGIVPTLFVEPGLLRIREAELLLQRPHVYRPVAERLALYCQSEPGLVPESMGAAYLPAPLRSRPHAAVYSSKEGASVELGGGFHHFGYDLEPVVQASTKDTRAWRLSFRSEGSPTLPLVTVRLPATAQASRDQISKWLGEAFPDQLAGAPASAAVHASRVQAHIRLGQVEAALRASDEWIAAAPEKVVPRFTRAHLLARLSQLASGAGEFARWVEAHASFEHRCYLFLFHMREGQAEQALAALRSALREPIELSATGPFNAAALGRDGAVFAFLQGDSRLSIELCQKLLDTNPEGFTRDLLILKAAAQARLGEWPAALETLERASATPAPSWREQGADDVILEAIRSRNLATIADYKRWRDPLADWCTPFDKDEAGARGGDPERFPNPYPRDWRRHAF
jgi:tetratricopeptide (TPR) repeat protein